jgi:hypothetical protein
MLPRKINSLTFFPKEGASGFLADHIGDVAGAEDMLWYGLEELWQSARTITLAW